MTENRPSTIALGRFLVWSAVYIHAEASAVAARQKIAVDFGKAVLMYLVLPLLCLRGYSIRNCKYDIF